MLTQKKKKNKGIENLAIKLAEHFLNMEKYMDAEEYESLRPQVTWLERAIHHNQTPRTQLKEFYSASEIGQVLLRDSQLV